MGETHQFASGQNFLEGVYVLGSNGERYRRASSLIDGWNEDPRVEFNAIGENRDRCGFWFCTIDELEQNEARVDNSLLSMISITSRLNGYSTSRICCNISSPISFVVTTVNDFALKCAVEPNVTTFPSASPSQLVRVLLFAASRRMKIGWKLARFRRLRAVMNAATFCTQRFVSSYQKREETNAPGRNS